MANTRFLEAQRARFEKSKEPVIKKKERAIEKFRKTAQEFNAEIRYYDAQLEAIDKAILTLGYTEDVPTETTSESAPPVPKTFATIVVSDNIDTVAEPIAEQAPQDILQSKDPSTESEDF